MGAVEPQKGERGQPGGLGSFPPSAARRGNATIIEINGEIAICQQSKHCMKMHNPPHPGDVLQDTVLREMTVTELAKRLSVSRVALNRVVNSRAAVSADLAIRLAAALGGSAETWMRMQVAYDLWHAQKKKRPKIRPIELGQVA